MNKATEECNPDTNQGSISLAGSSAAKQHADPLHGEHNQHPLLEQAFGSSMNIAGGAQMDAEYSDNGDEGSGWKSRAAFNSALCLSSSLAGFGMFSEAYFLFALGNVKELWAVLYPTCFNSSLPVQSPEQECSVSLVESLSYVEVGFVMVGMLTFGFIAGRLGRRYGSIMTACIMFIGGALQTAATGKTYNDMFVFFTCALAFFAYGVGGEYPLASASAAERAESRAALPGHHGGVIRGKTVALTFAMQGWGNWINTVVFCILLAAYNCGSGSAGALCPSSSLEKTWRIQYGIGALLLLIIVVGRIAFLKESEVWLQNKKKKKSHVKPPRSNLKMMLHHFWPRLIGTSLAWYVWDIVFYGNKLFQTTIIANIVGPDASILEILEYTLINSTFALIGYYVTAFTVDKRWLGRRRLQNIGFLMTFVLFLACGAGYDRLVEPQNVGWLQFLYYASSFFGQWGANATTWLLPSEVYPTEVRTEAHGFSAAMGKAGGLTATLLFTYGNNGHALGTQAIFFICSACGLVGLIVTILFIPEVTFLDLSENDVMWDAWKAGETYEGPAQYRKHVSNMEYMLGMCCKSPEDSGKDIDTLGSGTTGSTLTSEPLQV